MKVKSKASSERYPLGSEENKRDWHDYAIAIYYRTEINKKEVHAVLTELGYDVSYNTVKSFLYRHQKKYPNYKNLLINKKMNMPNELPEPKFKKKEVVQNHIPKETDVEWDGSKVIKFGLMGDTQLGSKYAQISHLHAFYDVCKALGVNTVYHTGDITDGIKMRPGQEFELYKISADEMKDDVVKNYPKFEGIATYFITGNHDASLYKHVGYDIGKAIALERDDLIYLGRDCAVVNITPNCTLELRHPWDGTAYAQSYKIQKMIEAMEADSKPNILAVGHYHKVEYLFYRNVHAFQTGCFQSQTPFTRGKGISVHMGGWIIAIEVDKDGRILRLTQQFIPFYTAIKDDYKHWIKE